MAGPTGYPGSGVAYDPITGIPRKTRAPRTVFNPIQGESKADAPFTNPIQPGTSSQYPGTLDIPGFTPDYKALIEGDPIYQQSLKDFGAQGVSDLATRNAGINRALVQFGALPDFQQAQQALGLNLGDVVGADTAGLASGNPYSTTRQLQQAHEDAVRQIRQALAARGALRSGELGYQLGRENQGYGQAQYNARQQVLDQIAGIQAGYAAAQQQRAAQQSQAATEAAQRQIGLHPATGTQTLKLSGYQNGQPVYGPDSSGQYRDSAGNVVSYSTTPAPPPTVAVAAATSGNPLSALLGRKFEVPF